MASQSLRPFGLLLHMAAFLFVCAFCLPGGTVLVEVIRLRKSFSFPTPIDLELVCAAAVVLALGLASNALIARGLAWTFVFLGYAALANSLNPDRSVQLQMIWLIVGAALGLIVGLATGKRRPARADASPTPSETAQNQAEAMSSPTFQPGWVAVLAGAFLVAATAILVIRYELRIATQTAVAEAVARTGGRTIYDNPGTPPLLFPWLDLALPHGQERLCLRSVELGPKAENEDLAELAALGLGRLPHLRELRMRESRVTDAGLALVAPLVELERITLGAATTDAGLAHLRGLPALRVLDLSRTRITGASLDTVGQFPALACLNLQRTSITNDDLVRLKGSRELLILDLSATSISDAGLVHLKDLPHLSALLLIETPVTDEGLKHLAQVPQLRWLFLAGSKVTPRGRSEFHRARPGVWTD
jgi:hypothetical protein